MRILAVDIVLLPSDQMLDRVIALNRALESDAPASIVLNQSDCLPHISLAMGCVTEEKLPSVEETLTAIAKAHPSIALTVTGLSERLSQTGERVSRLNIGRDLALQALHEVVMRDTAPFLSHEATPDMFADPTSVSASTVGWVNEYPSASFGRFWPHVTLGIGTLPEEVALPAPSMASRLALCHLGAHCTCRRILFETDLRYR